MKAVKYLAQMSAVVLESHRKVLRILDDAAEDGALSVGDFCSLVSVADHVFFEPLRSSSLPIEVRKER